MCALTYNYIILLKSLIDYIYSVNTHTHTSVAVAVVVAVVILESVDFLSISVI